MIESLVREALKQRLVVAVIAAVLFFFGLDAARKLSVDAFPDVTNVQVQIATEAPGRSPEEVERLVEQVLTARAQGVSVRACVRQMADGDRTRMLRYQNKYRSTVRTRPEIVRRVMDRLNEQGRAFVSPYAQEAGGAELAALKNRAQESGDAHIGQLFESLDYLLARALEKPADDGGAQRRADRLGARCDMLRIALDDEQKRFGRLKSEAGGMVTFLKEYVALPETARQSGLQAFCEQAAQRLSRVECALMDEP